MTALVPAKTLQKIDAVSRIQKSAGLNPKTSLVDLEQQVMADLMNNSSLMWSMPTLKTNKPPTVTMSIFKRFDTVSGRSCQY